MPVIQSVRCNPCVNRNDRLEMVLEATFVGAPPQRYSFNVSYKKHAMASYKTNWTPPPTADVNTLVNLSEFEFMAAFNEYGRLLGAKMAHQESTTFNPSAPMNRVMTHGIAFSSDVNNLGGNIHCFPVNLSPIQTPGCISLSRTAFDNFKLVARFLYRVGGVVPPGTARASWALIGPLVRGRVGQPNELFTAMDVQALDVRAQAGNAMQDLLNREQGEIRRAQNAGNQPNPNPGRPPFRGF